jgi:hypothetical protein
LSNQVFFLNLTNGIEYLQHFAGPVRFVRIQSTACEQGLWNKIIEDLDYTFLMFLAQGYECVVLDYSNKNALSRALWQGVPWIEYVLHRRWLRQDINIFVKSHNSKEFFSQKYAELSKAAKNKIDYAKKFLNCKIIRLRKMGLRTSHDGDYDYYRKLMNDELVKRANGRGT